MAGELMLELTGGVSFAAGEDLEFACWDKELRDAAADCGPEVVPHQL